MTPYPATHAWLWVGPAHQLETAAVLLAQEGCQMFQETDEGLWAYADVPLPPQVLADVAERLGVQLAQHSLLPGQNWNQVWEDNCPSLELPPLLQVVPWHRQPQPGFAYSLRISPQMAFGTGHHPTTRMLLQHMLRLGPLQGPVLDVGCGTGVLGMLAQQMGSQPATYLDIDPVAVETTRQNLSQNGLTGTVLEGSLGQHVALQQRQHRMVLANITRNVLQEEAPLYGNAGAPGGVLLLSGFLALDSEALWPYFAAIGCTEPVWSTENEWSSLCCRLP